MDLKIKSEIGNLLEKMIQSNWKIESSRYDADAFGNFIITLVKDTDTIYIIKDRSCYELCDEKKKGIIEVGLELDSDSLRKKEFCKKVQAWLVI